MSKSVVLCCVVLCCVFPERARAYEGSSNLLTSDGVPPEVVFEIGVPATKIVDITLRREHSATHCHGVTWSQFGLAGPLSLGFPCYGDTDDGTWSSVIHDAWNCAAGVGSAGEVIQANLGSGNPTTMWAPTLGWEIVYDGSSISPQSTSFRIMSNGRCSDLSPTDPYEVAEINIHFVSSGVTHQSFWQASSANATWNHFILNNATLDGRPDARIFVTDINDDGNGPTPGEYGVWWTGTKWSVYTESGVTMPTNRMVNVAFGGYGNGQAADLHVTTASNTAGNITILDHPSLNGNPNAQVFFQHVWNPPGHSANYFDHPLGVWYNASIARWTLYTEDLTAFPSGITFFVMVSGSEDGVSSGVWSYTAPNMTYYGTYIAAHAYRPTNPHYLTTPKAIHRVGFYHPLFGWNYNVDPGGTAGPSTNFDFFVWRPRNVL